jgi:hypothetical protein
MRGDQSAEAKLCRHPDLTTGHGPRSKIKVTAGSVLGRLKRKESYAFCLLLKVVVV